MPDEDHHRDITEPPSPTLRELAAILFRQRKILLSVFAIVLGTAILYAFAGAKYQAKMQVLVRRGRVDPPVNAQANAPPDFSRWEVTEEEINSEVELLQDGEVLRKVAAANDLASHDWLRWLRAREGDAVRLERAARRLAQNLKIEPVKKTNLIAVSYAASDPRLSANVLQSLACAYLDKHTTVHRPGGELAFFDQQAGESRRQLEAAQRNLTDFTQRNGVVAAAQQRDLLLRTMNDMETSYQQAQVAIQETRHRVQELEIQVASLPPRTTTQIRSADNPELFRALKQNLLELELKKTQLLTKFEPTHRLVLEVDQQILQTEAAIANEESHPLRDETTEKDANYEWAKAELQKAQVALKGLEAKAAVTRTQLGTYAAIARQLGTDAITQDDLLSSEKAAQQNYLLYVAKREEARMGDALDQRGIVNVAIAEEPVVPALPVLPAWTVLLAGFVVAGTSGVAAAFVKDYTDPALRTPEEVMECLDIPVLASLPQQSRRLSA